MVKWTQIRDNELIRVSWDKDIYGLLYADSYGYLWIIKIVFKVEKWNEW